MNRYKKGSHEPISKSESIRSQESMDDEVNEVEKDYTKSNCCYI